MGRYFILLVFLLHVSGLKADSITGDFLCDEQSCKKILCPPITCPYGSLMIDPSIPCSCCKLCINYIGENSACGPYHTSDECGPGLSCQVKTDKGYACLPVKSTCTEEQKKYDEMKRDGQVGVFVERPRCDEYGEYVGRRCQPGSSCYCVDKKNNHIFGEASATDAPDDKSMNCECSRDYMAALGMDHPSLQFPHCLPNGNYDPLQCIDNGCFCMYSSTNVTSPQPITSIDTLPCFRPEIHYMDYLRPCEKENKEKNNLINRFNRMNITVLGIELAKCGPDGFYAPVRKMENKYYDFHHSPQSPKLKLLSHSRNYCVDPTGKLIEDFQVDSAAHTAEDMNCACARTRFWLNDQGVSKPLCCTNGNYQPIQCRGGYCFCVDAFGNQLQLEVKRSQVESLPCYKVDYQDC